MNIRDRKIQIIITVTLCAVFVVLILVLGFGSREGREKKNVESPAETTEDISTDTDMSQDMGSVEKWQEGDVSFNGKLYHYNENLKTILLMGVDRSGVVTTAEDYVSGGQADAMFLLVIDNDNQSVKVVAINRNTIADVDVYNADGTFEDTLKYQICLQHAYGDGKRLSCDRTVDAVSRLFYNIPISGYLAMNMDGITVLNDALGGVEVEVLDDLQGYGVSLKKGDTVKLKGKQAELYLRGRDEDKFDSSTDRLERQQQYIVKLAEILTAAAKSDDELEQQTAAKAYDAVSDYVVSSVDFASLVAEISGYSFDEAEDMYTVPGTTSRETEWEEYNVDEDGLYELIIDVFYSISSTEVD